MRLYHHPFSSNARRAVMTAIHLGTPVELVVVDLMKGAHKAPDYMRMHPGGKVPVLDDDGFFLTESNAIMQYLAEKTPGQTVYPQDIRGRADVNRWLFWSTHHLSPGIGTLNFEHIVKSLRGMGAADPAEVEKGEARVKEAATLLDAHLAGEAKNGPAWIAQGRLTLADLSIASGLMTVTQAKLPITEFPHVMEWFGRVQQLDAWKKTNL